MTMKQFIHLGFNNWVASEKISVVQISDSAPARRFVQLAREQNVLIDATSGRKTESVIILSTGQIVLSALSPDTIVGRAEGANNTGK